MFMVLFLHGHCPAETEFARLAGQIEIFDRIEGASEELRQVVARRCPELLYKMQPLPKIQPLSGARVPGAG